MRAAFWMCATTGFTKGKCPKVLTKCWLPPMIYYTPEGQVRSHCTKAPKFSWTLNDVRKVRGDAWRKLGFDGEPPECKPCQEYLENLK